MGYIELTKDGVKEYVNTDFIMRVREFKTGMNNSGIQFIGMFVPYDETQEEIMEKITESKK